MSNDDKYAGTEQQIGRIDLGDIGTVVVYDDGYPDSDVTIDLYGSDTAHTVRDMLREYRHENGDSALEMALNALSAEETSDDDSGRTHAPAFSCDDCHRTWPGKRNQTPDEPEDTCPDCYDEDDD